MNSPLPHRNLNLRLNLNLSFVLASLAFASWLSTHAATTATPAPEPITVTTNSTTEPAITNAAFAAASALRQQQALQTAARLAEVSAIAATNFQSTASLSIATADLQATSSLATTPEPVAVIQATETGAVAEYAPHKFTAAADPTAVEAVKLTIPSRSGDLTLKSHLVGVG